MLGNTDIRCVVGGPASLASGCCDGTILYSLNLSLKI